MNKCRFCDAPMEEDASFCNECGKDNSDTVEKVEETVIDQAEKSASEIEETDVEAIEQTETEDEGAENAALTDATDIEIEDKDKEKTEWIAPPDPFEIKKKRKKNVITALIIGICVVAIGLLLFILFTTQKDKTNDTKYEQPMVYVDSNDELKIYMRGMEAPVLLGNQGHATDTSYEMLKNSTNNKNMAYITAGKSLFMLPVSEATSGVIDIKYHVEDDVKEILSFAPDNDSLLYYVGKDNVLKMFDGKTSTVIADDVYVPLSSSPEEIAAVTFFPLNNGRIVYYTGVEGATNLITEAPGKAEKAVLGNIPIQDVLSIMPEDEGVTYGVNGMQGETSVPRQLFYYDFKKAGEPVLIADVKNFLQAITYDGNGNVIVVEEIHSDSAEPTTDESGLSIIQPDAVAAIHLYLYTNTGERKLVTDNVNNVNYISEDGKDLIFNTLEGETISYWYALVDSKQNVVEPQLISTLEASAQVIFLEMGNDKDFVASFPNVEGTERTAKLYSIENDKLVEKKVLDTLGSATPYQTLNGQIFSLRNPKVTGDMFYVTNAYFMKDGESIHIADGVEYSSFGSFTAGIEKHDDRVMFMKDCVVEEGAPFGTLVLFDGTNVVEIAKKFLIPSDVRTIYVDDNLIYYFDIDVAGQKVNLMKYTGTEEQALVESGIQRIYSGH